MLLLFLFIFTALICGTSTGHMSISEAPIWDSGAWGPFKGVIFPDLFIYSAGQSTSGILLDFIVRSHPAYDKALENAGTKHMHTYLNELLHKIATREKLSDIQLLTKEIHVYPDFHGNRSPLADPSLRGMV